MSKYEKKRKIYNVKYETVDPLLPEMKKKVEMAFDVLFDAILDEGYLSQTTRPSDSTAVQRTG